MSVHVCVRTHTCRKNEDCSTLELTKLSLFFIYIESVFIKTSLCTVFQLICKLYRSLRDSNTYYCLMIIYCYLVIHVLVPVRTSRWSPVVILIRLFVWKRMIVIDWHFSAFSYMSGWMFLSIDSGFKLKYSVRLHH